MSTRRLRATALVLGLVAAAACTTDQPTQVATQTVSVNFNARANNDKWNCWDGPTGVYCEVDSVSSIESRAVPWGYDVEISLIPAGSTEETVVASSIDGTDVPTGFPVFGNMTVFDSIVEPGPTCPSQATPCTSYTNPRKVSRGSRDYASYQHLPLPEPNILNRESGAYEFTAHKGDTVIVRARKQLTSAWPGTVKQPNTANLTLSGTIALDGRVAQPLGTAITSFSNGAGVSFSYTLK